MNLVEFNAATLEEAYEHLLKCCTSTKWAKGMAAARPFASKEELYTRADEIWGTCSDPDFLEAFDGHPRIGDVSTLKEKYKNTAKDAGHEQSGCDEATDDVLQELKDKNDEYYNKFGFIFIVCATGKSATEMLQILNSRLPNEADIEIKLAANEQAKITQIRLEKLL